MKTKLYMSNGKEYVVNYDMESLNKTFLTHKDGSLINGIVYFSGFALNPSHIASLEEIDDVSQRVIKPRSSLI